jgi:hypothetical protein
MSIKGCLYRTLAAHLKVCLTWLLWALFLCVHYVYVGSWSLLLFSGCTLWRWALLLPSQQRHLVHLICIMGTYCYASPCSNGESASFCSAFHSDSYCDGKLDVPHVWSFLTPYLWDHCHSCCHPGWSESFRLHSCDIHNFLLVIAMGSMSSHLLNLWRWCIFCGILVWTGHPLCQLFVPPSCWFHEDGVTPLAMTVGPVACLMPWQWMTCALLHHSVVLCFAWAHAMSRSCHGGPVQFLASSQRGSCTMPHSIPVCYAKGGRKVRCKCSWHWAGIAQSV